MTKALLVLALAGLTALAAPAMAQDNETSAATCDKADYKVVPFMATPVTADDLDQLLSPVWWIMSGNSFRTYDKSELQPNVMTYLKTYSIQPIAGVGALFALICLSLLIFLLWRFTRCLCVFCCQQEAYADPSKVLLSRRLRIYKGLMVICGIIGIAMAGWGMESLNQNFPSAISQEIDSLQELPQQMLNEIQLLANKTANMTAPLNSFETIITEVNISGMKADLTHINDFFKNAPTPKLLKELIDDLTTALKVTLHDTLVALKSELDRNNDASILNGLMRHIDVLQNFTAQPMNETLAAYHAAIQAITPMPSTDNKTSLGNKFTDLVRTHAATNDGIPVWKASVANARASAAAIDNSRNSETANPFTLIKRRLTSVESAVTDIKTQKLTNLSTTIRNFNNMWYKNASIAVDDLVHKAVFVNSSIMELPSMVNDQMNNLQISLKQINSMYEGDDSLLVVPDNIDNLGGNLSLPDMANLKQQLTTAETQLNGAGPDLLTLIQTLDNLTEALNNLTTAVASIDKDITSLDNSGLAAEWTTLKSNLLGENGTQVAVAAAVFAVADLGPFVQTTAVSIKSTMTAASGNMSSQLSGIDDVEDSISEFNMDDFSTALNGADAAYAGGNPASMTGDVIDLLDNIGNNFQYITDAKDKINSTRDTINGLAGKLQEFTIDKIDNLQQKQFPVDAPKEGQSAIQKYWGFAYCGLIGAYGVILLLILVIWLFTWRNCPSGLCITGFLINILMILFAFLPIFYTIFMLLMRDTCANVETVVIKAVNIKFGPTEMPYKLANFYLGGGKDANGSSVSVTELFKSISPDYDIGSVKNQVNSTVGDMIQQIKAQYQLRPRVTNVLDDATGKVNGIMTSIDDLIELVDYPNISGWYHQFKGWLCCDLADQLFVQWAACLILLAMAWAVLLCAFAVLKNLDGLSDSCCACSCYNPSDYAAAPADKGEHQPLSAMESAGDEAVAVVNISTTTSTKGNKTYEQIDATPLPPPLAVMTSPASAPVLQSPRMYPSISAPPVPGGYSPLAPAPAGPPNDLQTQRASLMGNAMYQNTAAIRTGPYVYGNPYAQPGGAYMPQSSSPQPQGWAQQSPPPANGVYPRI